MTIKPKIYGAATKLAPFIDDSGKPTAGMRIEVPSHLQRDFRILFKFGQTLRAKHGAGTRRHVKFDDVERTLFLNARLPGDDAWSRISVDVAKKGLRARELVSDDEVGRRFDISGPLAQRPRAASSSLRQAPTPQPSAWTTRRPDSISS